MKSIPRAIVFSAVAIYATAGWNKGFSVVYDSSTFVKTTLIFALFYFLIRPLTKLILLPINWLTLGLLSSLANFLLFYFFFTRFPYIKIAAWKFQGLELFGFGIGPMQISYLMNIVLASISLSFIIKVLDLLL